MEPQAEADELYRAQTENRQLKESIGALRDKLEGMRFEKEQGVQQAVAAANVENVQLKAMVTALRGELEKMRFEKGQSVQQAVAAAAGHQNPLARSSAPFHHQSRRGGQGR